MSDLLKVIAYCDGSTREKQIAVVIEEIDTNEERHMKTTLKEATGTSNELEYIAVLETVKATKKYNCPVYIMSDSKLVVNQVNLKWKINYDRLRILAVQIWDIKKVNQHIVWLPREINLAGRIFG